MAMPGRRPPYHPLLILVLSAGLAAAEGPDGPGRGGSRMPVQGTAHLQVPAHALDVILGRPTATAITLSVLCYDDEEGAIAYGERDDRLDATTPPRRFAKGEAAEVVLSGLKPDTGYTYQFRGARSTGPLSTFHTARPASSSFVFTIVADSHLDDNTDPALYDRTMAGALADRPDFHIDLGDTFMTEKHASRADAAAQYLAQRWHLGQLCRSAPLFLALGNHDGEYPRGKDGDDLAVWSNQMRKRFYPNPLPDAFYAGNTAPHPVAGPLQDYYAWEWGGAQFIVLDPFWYSVRQRGVQGNWKRTLGEAQYRWLRTVLDRSTAPYRFVFIHHLVGGADAQARGGAEAATLYEWGGRNPDGSEGFAQNRPGWEKPIHQLLVQHHVAAVFHGHDHLYARQELDGIVYQEVPQPGHPGSDAVPASAREYGYAAGTILGGSGRLRVRITPERCTVELVRPLGALGHSYVILPASPKSAPAP